MRCGPTKETAHQHKTADKHVLIGRFMFLFFYGELKMCLGVE
ncbi:hypothetical protein M2419_004470 [Sphingobacterium sp. BIGb0116]|nr:hypothetical protein [Sphingobacterium sp. BIGb0116]